jgi:hypothetical protein
MFYIVKIYIFEKKIFSMMGEKKAEKVVQEGSGTSFLAGQVQPSPATSEVGIQKEYQSKKQISEWEKLKQLIYQQLGGKYIIVEKENQILVEADGLKILIEKDAEAHAYDYWTITVQTKILDMFISTGLLQCFYSCELHQRTKIEIEERWYPEEDLYDCVDAEEALNTIKQIIVKYEKNYEEGLVAWFFNTYLTDFY